MTSQGPDEQDIQAIRQVIAEANTFQSDTDGFTGLLTDDVAIVNIAGRRVSGKANLYRAMQEALASSLAQVLTTTEVDDIRFVRPDVAVVSCIKRVSDQRDEAAAALPEAGRVTFVLVREQGRWLATSVQTTPIKQ